METMPNITQLPTASRLLTPQLQTNETELQRSKENLLALESARRWAGKVLNSYPDYAKSPPAYTASIVEAFAGYPEHLQEALADKKTGIVAKCEFLPTVAAIVKMAEELELQHERREAIRAKPKRYGEEHIPARGYSPFPQLSRAFSDKPEMLNAPFETLDQACRVLVLQGKQAAENVLKASKFKRQHSQEAA